MDAKMGERMRGDGKAGWRGAARRGEWGALMIGLIIALVLLSILIYLWVQSGGNAFSWVDGVVGLAKP